MTTDTRRLTLRSAAWVAAAHTVLVIVTVVVELTVISPIGWRVARLLRLIDFPVIRLIDWTLQNVPLIPPWASFGRLTLVAALDQILVHGIFGGALYAVVAAIFVAFVRRPATR